MMAISYIILIVNKFHVQSQTKYEIILSIVYASEAWYNSSKP